MAVLIIVVAGLLVWAMHGCYRAIQIGQREAGNLAIKLHEQMGNHDFGVIYTESSLDYKKAESKADSEALFSGITRKLGKPTKSEMINMNISATTSGKIITAAFSTDFSTNVLAQETIRWRKEQGAWRLLSYSINSNALVTR